jgi:hypothetical protein
MATFVDSDLDSLVLLPLSAFLLPWQHDFILELPSPCTIFVDILRQVIYPGDRPSCTTTIAARRKVTMDCCIGTCTFSGSSDECDESGETWNFLEI